VSSVAEVVAALELLDVAALSREEVQGAYRLTRQVRGWLDVCEGRLARRLGEIAEKDMTMLPEADIAAASKSTHAEASKATKRAKTLGEVPQLEAALAAGEVSAEHVDAVTRATRRLKPEDRDKLTGDGDRLAAEAARSTPEEFESHLKSEIARIDSREGGERLLRQKRAIRLRSWTDRESGMVIVRVELDPETGLRVISRIDKTVERLFHGKTPDDCPADPEFKQDYLLASRHRPVCSGCRRRPRWDRRSTAVPIPMSSARVLVFAPSPLPGLPCNWCRLPMARRQPGRGRWVRSSPTPQGDSSIASRVACPARGES
jgi:uncharacterized protein DUF222